MAKKEKKELIPNTNITNGLLAVEIDNLWHQVTISKEFLVQIIRASVDSNGELNLYEDCLPLIVVDDENYK